MNLDKLLTLPRSGVVILKKGNSVLIGYTSSMGAYLETLYNDFRGQTGIEMRVYSEGVDLETLRLHTEYYRKVYVSKGFSMIIDPLRKAVKFRVRMVPSPDFKHFNVEIVSARGDSRVVGKFKSNKEAKGFIETYYGTDNPLVFPVYAANTDTKVFLQEQTKMLDIK